MIVLLAESAWIYLALHSILTASNPGMAFSPAAVLAPYGLSALTTYLLGLVREPSPRPSPLLPSLGARLLDAALAAAITALHLALCLACLLTVLWWEMYRGQKLLDPSWLNLAMEEVRGPLGGFPPAVSLAILGVALWWRGTQLARERSLFPRLVARFLWGHRGAAGHDGPGGRRDAGSGLRRVAAGGLPPVRADGAGGHAAGDGAGEAVGRRRRGLAVAIRGPGAAVAGGRVRHRLPAAPATGGVGGLAEALADGRPPAGAGGNLEVDSPPAGAGQAPGASALARPCRGTGTGSRGT